MLNMDAPNKSAPLENNLSYWRRVLRPLAWWLLFVLVLASIRLHQHLMAGTYLRFSITVEGKPNPYYGRELVQLDGKEYYSGKLVSLGDHELTISHSKTDTYRKQLFVWYGVTDLGEISLKRSRGLLQIKCDPPAAQLQIEGPEFSTRLTNAPGFKANIPVDNYRVNVTYAYWNAQEEVGVWANGTVTRDYTPRFGGLNLTCNQSGATFELRRRASERPIESGTLPEVIAGLPVGDYRLDLSYHGHEKSENVIVKFGVTNEVKTEFLFGTAAFQTQPAGAAVHDRAGRYLGQTPLTLPELQPGSWTFQLKLAGYEPVTTTLEIAADETQSFRTNLISVGYTSAMRAARNYMTTLDYDQALSALADALLAKSGDADALDLQREASGFAALQKAKAKAGSGNHILAGAYLVEALKFLPGNTEALALQTEYKAREPEQLERERLERLTRAKTFFDSLMAKTPDSQLFETYELKTTKPAKDLLLALGNAMQNQPAPFKLRRCESPQPETFCIRAIQEFNTVLATSTGRRDCYIVGGQTTDNETKIYFKVLEYKAKHNVTMPGLLAFKDDIEFIPIHPSRIPDMNEKLQAQLIEGVTNVTARIQSVIGP